MMFCLDVILKLEGTNYNKTEKSPPKYHAFMCFNSDYKYDTSVTTRHKKWNSFRLPQHHDVKWILDKNKSMDYTYFKQDIINIIW